MLFLLARMFYADGLLVVFQFGVYTRPVHLE